MKILLLAFISLFFALPVPAQHSKYQYKTVYKDFKFKGSFPVASKEDIIKRSGKPRKVFEPKYECGFLSEDEQRKKFYTLKYVDFHYTGNKPDGYLLEEIIFNSKTNLNITYRGKTLSYRTSKKEFEEIFDIKVDGEEPTFFRKGTEDALIFYFQKGRLYKLEYWSPC